MSNYAYNFKRFVQWCSKYAEIKSVLPANELYVSLYLQHLMQSKKHYSTVEAAFYSIRWAHNLARVVDPCQSTVVQSILEAAKRSLNRPVQKKVPIDEDAMIKLYNFYCDRETVKDYRILALCFLSYFGFLRYNELCHIKRSDVDFRDNYIDIFIPKAKTDCYHKGNHVFIAKSDSCMCPVKILIKYLNMANIDENSDMYIFRPVNFCKKSQKFTLRKGNTCISYTRARELIKEALALLGFDAKKFGTHSFRSGGATSAAKQNVPDRLFKMHGRWKSESAKDGYVSESLHKRLSVSKMLHFLQKK